MKEGLITLQEKKSSIQTESKLRNTIFTMIKENQDLQKEIWIKENKIKSLTVEKEKLESKNQWLEMKLNLDDKATWKVESKDDEILS